jgi:hypothetical protein
VTQARAIFPPSCTTAFHIDQVHLLSGTTFSSAAQRGKYKSPDAAVRELETWLLVQTAGIHHTSPHQGLGKPPLKAWGQAMQSHAPLRLPANEQQFYIDFLLYKRRAVTRAKSASSTWRPTI